MAPALDAESERAITTRLARSTASVGERAAASSMLSASRAGLIGSAFAGHQRGEPARSPAPSERQVGALTIFFSRIAKLVW